MKLHLPALIIVAMLFSCSGNKTEATEQTTSKDSVAAAPASINMTPSAPVYNPADSGTFKGFIDLFSSTADLPEWAVAFTNQDYVGRYTPLKVLATEPHYLLLYIQFVPAGPGVDKLWAISFTKDGEFISDAALGESYPSSGPMGDGKDYNFTYDEVKKVIRVSDITITWNEEEQQEVTDETWYYYYLDADGNIVEGRKYPFISQQRLVATDLERYSKGELKIMRNEIFAVYGYIFKTEPLKSYYAAQPWYTGDVENVDEFLTETEKANVAVIKEVEDSK